jgi:hypothetical protein
MAPPPAPVAAPGPPTAPPPATAPVAAAGPVWPSAAPERPGSPAAAPGDPVWPSAPPVAQPPAGPPPPVGPAVSGPGVTDPAAADPAAGWPSAPPVGDPGAWPAADPTSPFAGTDGPGPAFEDIELPPQNLWQKMKADPQYAPEHLTLEAIARLGPPARAWVDRTRAQYPGIPADTVAQIAARRFTAFARLSGAAAGATGLPGAVIDVGVLAWTQARMVLHIAAAYGVDPTDPERATDLLVLQNVHKYAETARTALAVARGHEQAGALFSKGPSAPMARVLVQLGLKLAHMAGVKAAKKMFAKMVPGASIILGTWANSAATKDLAKRTVALYRKHDAHPYQLPPAPRS